MMACCREGLLYWRAGCLLRGTAVGWRSVLTETLKSCSVAQCEERLGQLSLFRGSWERGRVVSVCGHA